MDTYHSLRREQSTWIRFCSRVAAMPAPKSSPVPFGMLYTRLNMLGSNMKMEEKMQLSTAKIVAVTSSLASATGRSPLTLGSSTTIVGGVPTSDTASATTARLAMAKVAFVGLDFVDGRGKMDRRLMLEKYSSSFDS